MGATSRFLLCKVFAYPLRALEVRLMRSMDRLVPAAVPATSGRQGGGVTPKNVGIPKPCCGVQAGCPRLCVAHGSGWRGTQARSYP